MDFSAPGFESDVGALPAGEAAAAGDPEVVGGTVSAGEGCCAGDGWASGTVDCKTECEPVITGSDNIKAMSMKDAAAPIVILLRMLAVPRGPNAVLETLLEKRSPAPDFPGCSKITTTKTTHARINRLYRR